MKAEDIRALSSEEIQARLEDAYQELFNLRFQLATQQLKNPNRLTEVKRDIARMKTILRERELWQLWEEERA
ncbi:MAG: 50S ribosomal protein L29 [Anaerolineae bacterium]